MAKASQKTIESNLRRMKGYTLADLTALSRGYANKDANLVRNVMNKPHLSDKSALAQSRLANQVLDYMEHMEF